MGSETPSAESVFCAAVEIQAPQDRDNYVNQTCQDNEDLKDRVRKLLDAHFRAGAFLDAPASALDATTGLPPITEGPGTIIDRYKLLQQIGEGGFGVVFMAEQTEPVRRKVALKIIKPGMDTNEVIARFQAEAQALALMDHPNIARVFDAGATESGRPYFVMELVRGIPITDYCDQNNLAPRERLELFVHVCQAVQHAHQKGVIHRDIKPSNVLVTLHDGTPVVKMIDFGIAKAINQQLTERTLFTKFAQMVGTPLYMSPEQAEMSGLDVDTRTDIYALGVLLYELLTGATPFDKERLREAAYDEVRRIIHEEEPPRPSQKISTLGERASAVSSHRKTDPNKLSALVRGDLDWIVMKALEKDRTRRYETAKDLGVDVLRHIENQPVEARPPSAAYRFRKFVRRNKVAVRTASLVAVVLILGAVATGWQVIRRIQIERAGTVSNLNLEVRAAIEGDRLADAERFFDELADRGLRGHPETLRTARQLAMAYADHDRLEDAAALLRKTREIQRVVLGEDHADSRQTAKSVKNLAERCSDRAYELSSPIGAPTAACDRAVRLATIGVELAPSPTYGRQVLAIAQYRRGELKASLNSVTKSLELEQVEWLSPYEWLLLAMVHRQLGDELLARDFYTCACEGITNRNITSKDDKDLIAMRDEARSVLNLPSDWRPANCMSDNYVKLYSRMIERQPRVPAFLGRRASQYGYLRRWKEAAADYASAVELQPDRFGHWQARGVVCLEMEDLQGYEAVCRNAFERFRSHEDWVSRTGLVVLCCLRPSIGVAPDDLDRIADGVLSSFPKPDGFQRLAKGMALYRCDRFREAADVLPNQGFNNPAKDKVLALLFSAMTHQKLGHPDQARQLLVEARREIKKQEQVPTPDGVSFPIEDRSVIWCFIQTPLREAEALIEPAGKPAPPAK